MKKYLLYIFCFVVLIQKGFLAQTWIWDSIVISDEPISLVKDHANHVYTFINHGNVLAKYNSTGELLWQKIFPAYSIKVRNVVCGDDNTLYVMGTFYGAISIDSQTITSDGISDIFLSKFSESGALMWLRSVSNKGNEEAGDICLDKTGKLLITGSTSDTTVFSGTIIPKAPNRDLFVARYDLSGNFEKAFFASYISSAYFDGGSCGLEIEVDNNDDILLLAGVHGKIQIDTITFDDYYSSYFIKLDHNLNVKWSRRSEGGYAEPVDNMTINSKNDIIYTVNSYWHYQNYGSLRKLSSDGASISNYYSTIYWGEIFGVDLDSSDNVYFAGIIEVVYSWGGAPPPKIILQYGKVNSNGSLEWLITDSANSSRRAGYDIAALNENFFVAGEFSDSIHLFHSYHNTGPYNKFLAVVSMKNVEHVVDNSVNSTHYKIYPNPSSGFFTLKGEITETIISVHDVLGKCVWNKEYRNETEVKINLSDQPKGIYFVEISAGDKKTVRKIVIE